MSITRSSAWQWHVDLHRWLRLLWQVFVITLDVYGFAVVVLLVFRAVVGERWPIIAFTNLFLHFLLVASLVIVPIRLFARRRWLVILNLVPALLLVAYYVPNFLPPSARADSGTSIRVFSYNVSGGIVDVIESFVDDVDPDVILLQDVNAGNVIYLNDALKPRYPYVAINMRELRAWVTFSRLPFVEDPYRDGEAAYQRITVDVAGQPVTIYNVHLRSPIRQPRKRGIFFDFDTRGVQLELLREAAAQRSDHVLLMGDFNLTEWSDLYPRMAADYQDAHRVRGWGFGFTRDAIGEIPIARIDYAFSSADLRPLAVHTWDYSAGSDHRPLLVDLAVN
ncbi:MAG: endonuclease/exonuclease/phosphatase family protein [Anaerolineae bacterium]|nr:endonuclease/exonuclease/phosphatase family protein [Anaerolineae bacterium]